MRKGLSPSILIPIHRTRPSVSIPLPRYISGNDGNAELRVGLGAIDMVWHAPHGASSMKISDLSLHIHEHGIMQVVIVLPKLQQHCSSNTRAMVMGHDSLGCLVPYIQEPRHTSRNHAIHPGTTPFIQEPRHSSRNHAWYTTWYHCTHGFSTVERRWFRCSEHGLFIIRKHNTSVTSQPDTNSCNR